MNNTQVPTKNPLSLHLMVLQFGDEKKVPEEIVTKEVLRRTEAEKTP